MRAAAVPREADVTGQCQDEHDAGGGRFSTPTTPGLYFYKVRAEWSGRGFIQYYFALQVRELQI